jgi:hypothetical protein
MGSSLRERVRVDCMDAGGRATQDAKAERGINSLI